MSFIRRDWTPREADEWTREDTITVIISPLIYMMILVGGAMSALMMPAGFAIFGLGIVLLLLMIRIINPKLTAISKGYEEKQKGYIEELERKIRWEE
jgi:hypothetical protein